jgi:hypothetical protein
LHVQSPAAVGWPVPHALAHGSNIGFSPGCRKAQNMGISFSICE